MKIRSRCAITAIAVVLLCPGFAAAAEGAEEPGTWHALIFYIINFALFAWIIKRFGGPMIVGFFKERARGIRSNLSRATEALQEAQELAQRAAQASAGLAAEKARISSELAAETAYQVEQIGAMGRESAERIRRDAVLGVTAAREAGQRRLREALAAAAGRIARDVVSGDFQPGDQARLLTSFVGRLNEEARH
jgi:F0F1-type ATP synthase membrane subunit b/b'